MRDKARSSIGSSVHQTWPWITKNAPFCLRCFSHCKDLFGKYLFAGVAELGSVVVHAVVSDANRGFAGSGNRPLATVCLEKGCSR